MVPRLPSCLVKRQKQWEKRRENHMHQRSVPEERTLKQQKHRLEGMLRQEGDTRQCEMSISKNSGAVFIMTTRRAREAKLEKCNFQAAPSDALNFSSFFPSLHSARHKVHTIHASFELNPEQRAEMIVIELKSLGAHFQRPFSRVRRLSAKLFRLKLKRENSQLTFIQIFPLLDSRGGLNLLRVFDLTIPPEFDEKFPCDSFCAPLRTRKKLSLNISSEQISCTEEGEELFGIAA